MNSNNNTCKQEEPLSKIQRLTLINQYKILAELDKENRKQYEELKKVF